MPNPPYPDYPYSPPIQGAFHNQPTLAATVPGQYSVYIPENFEPCSPAVLILPPNGVSAQSFYSGTAGAGWTEAADNHGFALVIAEAHNAGNWNLGNAPTSRFDEFFLYEIWDTINKKFTSIPAAFDLDERALYLCGYEEGGSAAHKMAMLWPQLFAGLVSIDGEKVPPGIIANFGGKLSFPFVQSQNSDGRETIGLSNRNIPVPAWLISTGDYPGNEDVKNYWVTNANATEGDPNAYADETYANDAVRIWVTRNSVVSQEVIYSEFLYQVQRFDHIPGGELKWRIVLENNGTSGFFFTEDEVNGYIRRWWTYIPSSYNPQNEYPLVIGMHGGSNDAAAFIGDSRWREAAENYGLIVVFPMAYPCPLELMNWIPVPIWNQYTVSPNTAPDDVSFILEVIARTKTAYSVDESRIFATGHSNGAGMTWRLGLDTPEALTAICPAGYTMGSIPDGAGAPDALEAPLPVWVFMGRYDALNADEFRQGNWNDRCLNYWAQLDSFVPDVLTTGYDGTGRYYTRTWTNGNDSVPIFRYSSVAECPHIYQPHECELVWEEYFSKITLHSNGKRYYENQEIVP
jgi:polyhydroxybutyrate depolymerase